MSASALNHEPAIAFPLPPLRTFEGGEATASFRGGFGDGGACDPPFGDDDNFDDNDACLPCSRRQLYAARGGRRGRNDGGTGDLGDFDPSLSRRLSPALPDDCHLSPSQTYFRRRRGRYLAIVAGIVLVFAAAALVTAFVARSRSPVDDAEPATGAEATTGAPSAAPTPLIENLAVMGGYTWGGDEDESSTKGSSAAAGGDDGNDLFAPDDDPYGGVTVQTQGERGGNDGEHDDRIQEVAMAQQGDADDGVTDPVAPLANPPEEEEQSAEGGQSSLRPTTSKPPFRPDPPMATPTAATSIPNSAPIPAPPPLSTTRRPPSLRPSAPPRPHPPPPLPPPPPPGGDRAGDIFALLRSALAEIPQRTTGRPLSYDPVEELSADGSASHRAYRWLVETDPLQLEPSSSVVVMANVSGNALVVIERFVVARLFLGTGGIFESEEASEEEGGSSAAGETRGGGVALPVGGHGWIDIDGYLTGASVCEWYGVECRDRRPSSGEDDDGKDTRPRRRVVVGLHLAENGLAGTDALPPELILLRGLKTLDFRDNDLAGRLPGFLSLLPSLTYVDLSENAFAGAIPDDLYDTGGYSLSSGGGEGEKGDGADAELEHLDLGGNRLTGMLSTEGVGKGNWGGLKYLSVEDNFLSGTVPKEVAVCAAMEHLNLGKNFFSGPFPWSSVAANMASLRSLWIYGNDFSGALPSGETTDGGNSDGRSPGLGNLGRLTHLVIHDNGNIAGGIPAELGDLAELTHLYLHGTGLSGTVPSSLGSLSKLEVLHLHHTSLTGAVPPEVCDLRASPAPPDGSAPPTAAAAFLSDLRADCAAPLVDTEGSEESLSSASAAGSGPKIACSCCTHCFQT